MNKNILYVGLGIGGAAMLYMMYRFMQTPSQSYTTTSPNPYNNPSTGNTSGYPFQAPVTPRMDNSNQPWANNNRTAINAVSVPQVNTDLNNVASLLASGVSIGKSLTSIWEDFGVSDWFSSGDADSFMADYDYSQSWDVDIDQSQYGEYV